MLYSLKIYNIIYPLYFNLKKSKIKIGKDKLAVTKLPAQYQKPHQRKQRESKGPCE